MGLRTKRYGPRTTRWRGGSIGAGVPRPVTANSHKHQKYPAAPAARTTRPTIDPASVVGAGIRRAAAIRRGMSTPAVPGTSSVNKRFFSRSMPLGEVQARSLHRVDAAHRPAGSEGFLFELHADLFVDARGGRVLGIDQGDQPGHPEAAKRIIAHTGGSFRPVTLSPGVRSDHVGQLNFRAAVDVFADQAAVADHAPRHLLDDHPEVKGILGVSLEFVFEGPADLRTVSRPAHVVSDLRIAPQAHENVHVGCLEGPQHQARGFDLGHAYPTRLSRARYSLRNLATLGAMTIRQ